MLRIAAVLIALIASQAAQAEPLCGAAAGEVDRSLRAYAPRNDARHPAQRISIRNAVLQHQAAGLDFGARIDVAELAAFPMTTADRAAFDNALSYVYRGGGGGDNGLVMLDAVAGTAHCHNPFLFSRRSGAWTPVKAPDAEPFSLCAPGGVALGSVADQAFYAQTNDDYLESDELTVFPFVKDSFRQACVIAAHYQILFETAERFCKEPVLCQDYAEKAAIWAERLRSFGSVEAPELASANPPGLKDERDELPLFGAKESVLVPEPFRFDGSETWFALKDDPRADFLRLGPAHDGPRNMANWDSFTLAALYKGGQPVASFVVEKRRGAFQDLGLYESLDPQMTPSAVVAAIYRTAAGAGGDYSHSISVIADPRSRAHYLSERLQRELKEMDARTPAGDAPDLDFDPITSSQDPDVRGLRIATEAEGARAATVRAEFHRGGPKGKLIVLHYSLTRESGAWRVDDIAEQGKDGWRLSAILKRR
jgi:hypothetical protein